MTDKSTRVPPADVTEHELPGIGRRYDVPDRDGGTASVVIHHSGRRDLYVLPAGHDEPAAAVSFTDAQARTLAAVFGGAYFKPAIVEDIEAVIGSLLIDWVTLRDDSPGANRSIAELEIRQSTRMTVVAILRDSSPIVAPEPSERLLPGDRLVVVGRQDDLPGFLAHVVDSRDG